MYTFAYIYIYISFLAVIYFDDLWCWNMYPCIYIYIYNGMSGIPWYIYLRWNEHVFMFVLSRFVIVSKKDGLGEMWGSDGLGVEWSSPPKESSKAEVVVDTVATGHGSTRSLVLAIFHLSARLHDSGWLVRLVGFEFQGWSWCWWIPYNQVGELLAIPIKFDLLSFSIYPVLYALIATWQVRYWNTIEVDR